LKLVAETGVFNDPAQREQTLTDANPASLHDNREFRRLHRTSQDHAVIPDRLAVPKPDHRWARVSRPSPGARPPLGAGLTTPPQSATEGLPNPTLRV
jgi:hypothetical protein